MLYIHELHQLNERSADVESVSLIREIKQQTPYPFEEAKLQAQFLNFFASPTDIAQMEQSFALIPQTIEDIALLIKSRDECLEPINVQRAHSMLKEIPAPLAGSITYVKGIASSQEAWVHELTDIFNSIPRLKTTQEKIDANNRFKAILKHILRNNEFKFNTQDIIWEAQKARMADLLESMEKGFFFHFSIQDQLKHLTYHDIKSRLPSERMQQAEAIKAKIVEIKKGVDRAYDVNFRMIEWSVLLYSYVKWVLTIK